MRCTTTTAATTTWTKFEGSIETLHDDRCSFACNAINFHHRPEAGEDVAWAHVEGAKMVA